MCECVYQCVSLEPGLRTPAWSDELAVSPLTSHKVCPGNLGMSKPRVKSGNQLEVASRLMLGPDVYRLPAPCPRLPRQKLSLLPWCAEGWAGATSLQLQQLQPGPPPPAPRMPGPRALVSSTKQPFPPHPQVQGSFYWENN